MSIFDEMFPQLCLLVHPTMEVIFSFKLESKEMNLHNVHMQGDKRNQDDYERQQMHYDKFEKYTLYITYTLPNRK